MKTTTNPFDLAHVTGVDADESDLVIVEDESDATFKPVPHGLILRTNAGPVYVMGDDGKWHRHSSVRS